MVRTKLALLQALLSVSLTAVVAAQGTRATTRSEELDRLVDELRQQGSEAKARRRIAIERLLAAPEQRAHEALAAALDASEDADLIANSLVAKLQNPSDPVLGWAVAGGGRARLVPIWCDAAVQAVGGAVLARGTNGTSSPQTERWRGLLLALR